MYKSLIALLAGSLVIVALAGCQPQEGDTSTGSTAGTTETGMKPGESKGPDVATPDSGATGAATTGATAGSSGDTSVSSPPTKGTAGDAGKTGPTGAGAGTNPSGGSADGKGATDPAAAKDPAGAKTDDAKTQSPPNTGADTADGGH